MAVKAQMRTSVTVVLFPCDSLYRIGKVTARNRSNDIALTMKADDMKEKEKQNEQNSQSSFGKSKVKPDMYRNMTAG